MLRLRDACMSGLHWLLELSEEERRSVIEKIQNIEEDCDERANNEVRNPPYWFQAATVLHRWSTSS